MYKLKENQTLSKAVNEGFFSRLKKDIRKITDKKIQKLIQKGERNTAAFLKDFKKDPDKYIKQYEKEFRGNAIYIKCDKKINT